LAQDSSPGVPGTIDYPQVTIAPLFLKMNG
jgi:hypothetical protein